LVWPFEDKFDFNMTTKVFQVGFL